MSPQLSLLAEWTDQDGVLLAWPHAESDWQPLLPRIEQVYCELVFHIARHEHVVVLCNTPGLVDSVRNKLAARAVNLQRVHLSLLVVVSPAFRSWGQHPDGIPLPP